jgi:hypothetical protein
MEGTQQIDCSSSVNELSDKWVLWAHLPHNTDWSLRSYTNICELDTVEKVISLNRTLPEQLVQNCMLFLMKKGILPMWEDPKNLKGGCFSFKVTNKNIKNVWKSISYMLTGNSLSKNKELVKTINGVTISPKKSFCILKIWMETITFQTVTELNNVPELSFTGCIFKKHKPDF